MGSDVFAAFEGAILAEIDKFRQEIKEDDYDPPSHRGKLVIDATVAEQTIRNPSDLGLLSESREITEELINEMAAKDGGKKPRTYRQQARKRYLNLAKNRNPGKKLLRQGVRQQLQYIRRNLTHIDDLLDGLRQFPLPPKKQKKRGGFSTLRSRAQGSVCISQWHKVAWSSVPQGTTNLRHSSATSPTSLLKKNVPQCNNIVD